MKAAFFFFILCFLFFLTGPSVLNYERSAFEWDEYRNYGAFNPENVRAAGHENGAVIYSSECFTGNNPAVVVPRQPDGTHYGKQAPVTSRLFSRNTHPTGIGRPRGAGRSNNSPRSFPLQFPLRV